MGLLFSALPNRYPVDEITTCNSFSVIACDRYFGLMTETVENQVSHTVLLQKEVKPLLLCLIIFDSHFS
jgi:hypothetical protein